jgi:hypothetical protein
MIVEKTDNSAFYCSQYIWYLYWKTALRVDYLGREKQGDLSTVFIDNFYWITNDVKNIERCYWLSVHENFYKKLKHEFLWCK